MFEVSRHPQMPDILVGQNPVFGDERGWFTETYREEWEDKIRNLTDIEWVQDNVSSSRKGALRGLHYQRIQPQAKWVRIIKGHVLDVAVDLRKDSPTFGKAATFELDERSGKSIIIPVGFAHGFVVYSDEAIFSYKCSDYYCKEGERGILWSDPSLNIDWGVDNPTISEKDRLLPLLKDLPKEDLF